MEYTIDTYVFGDWQITREIGEGSFGKVFEIQKTDYGVTTRSALKVIRVPKNQTDIRAALADGMDEKSVTSYFMGFVEEIVKEIAIMSSLKSHPGIVSCEDHKVIEHAGQIGWDILIRMELLHSLNDYQLSHTMDEKAVLKMAIDLTSALAFCQTKALIHRDIKPENIFVSESGQFKLGDFGVARTAEKTTGGLSKKGTESYMAPEVYLARPYGITVDIYSLGLVLYKFLNHGRLPFLPAYPAPITFADRENSLVQRMQGVPFPPPAAASPEFAAIILKACAYNPEDRYRTAAEMLEALQGLNSFTATPEPVLPAASVVEASPLPAEESAKPACEGTIGFWSPSPQAKDTDDQGTVGMWSSAPSQESAFSALEDEPSPVPIEEPSPAEKPAPAAEPASKPVFRTPPVTPPVPAVQPQKMPNRKLLLGCAAAAVALIVIICLIFAGGDDQTDMANQNVDGYHPSEYELDAVQSMLWDYVCNDIIDETSSYQNRTASMLIDDFYYSGYYFLQADRSTFDTTPYMFSDGEAFGITNVYDSYQYAIAVPPSLYDAYGPNIPAESLQAYITICADKDDNLLVVNWTWNPAMLDWSSDEVYWIDLPNFAAGYFPTDAFWINFWNDHGLNVDEEMLAILRENDNVKTDTGFTMSYHESLSSSCFDIELPRKGSPFDLISVTISENERSFSLYYVNDARDILVPDEKVLISSSAP